MKLSYIPYGISTLVALVASEILQNGQPRITDYPDTVIDASSYEWNTYSPSADEISYKGRWDSKFISWWSAPGLKFGFTGEYVAITFGPYTVDTTLIGYRIDGQDWQFTNVTANAAHLLVSPSTTGVNLTTPITPSTFELRVTNWAYGVQMGSVRVAAGHSLIKIPNFGRAIEIIGDSLSAGQYSTYEGLSSYAYGLGAGLGDTEYSVTAYPGICMVDQDCWGNLRGQLYQYWHIPDTSYRATQIWGEEPELWDFSKQQPPEIVLINLGTNDNNTANNVTNEAYVEQYTTFVEGIHAIWPKAQIILISLWNGFGAIGNSYEQGGAFVEEIYSIYEYFNTPEYLRNNILYDHIRNTTYKSNTSCQPFVSYFNTTGLMQHNDIGPQWHPTDVGHVKLASNLIQYIKLKFDWVLYATGPEVQHDTLYWNDQQNY